MSPYLPPVSALCPTYARPHLLEEAIFSFLQQDYEGQKELVILNDFDQQTLVFDHPEVKLINVPTRFSSLGEKRNATAALATHDIFVLWDDDDICLPHRISLSVKNLEASCGYFKQGEKVFQMNNGMIVGTLESGFHCTCAYTRELFDKVGGYRAMDSGEDYTFECSLKAIVGDDFPEPLKNPSDFFYLYRWGGTGSYHASWYKSEPQESGTQKIENFVHQELNKALVPTGIITLKPQWHADYCKLNDDYISQLAQ